jgi:DNA-binding NarL/FixJ family response regulator
VDCGDGCSDETGTLQRQQQESLNIRGLSKADTGRLSSREMEVLQRIAEGAANKQIAADLGISIKTVEKHRDHLMKKLDIHDTASLTRVRQFGHGIHFFCAVFCSQPVANAASEVS